MAELGWGSPAIQYEYRLSSDPARMSALAQEIVALAPDVIVVHSNAFLSALRDVNRGIPTVFAQVADPVGSGFVDNLAHPGGSITGFTSLPAEIGGKWLEILSEAAPFLTHVLTLFQPESSANRAFVASAQAAAATRQITIKPAPVRSATDIENAVKGFGPDPAAGLMVMPSPITGSNPGLIAGLALRQRLPCVYPFRFFVTDGGGLMAYGPDTVDLYERAAVYVDRILRGARPADLPVQEPTKFELIVNLKAARAIGLVFPAVLLARAEEIVE